MALARVKVWVREVLTFANLHTEFDNILDNALSPISPLTGNLDVNDKNLNNIGTADVTTLTVSGTSTLTGATTQTGALTVTAAIIPGTAPSPPAQHGLYREMAAAVWCIWDTTGAISDSHNVTSVTDTAAGDAIVTFDRDFAGTTYVAIPGASHDASSTATLLVPIAVNTGKAVGSIVIQTRRVSDAALTDPNHFQLVCFGAQ